MTSSTDPWDGTGPLLVLSAWALAVVVTIAAVVAGVRYLGTCVTRRPR